MPCRLGLWHLAGRLEDELHARTPRGSGALQFMAPAFLSCQLVTWQLRPGPRQIEHRGTSTGVEGHDMAL